VEVRGREHDDLEEKKRRERMVCGNSDMTCPKCWWGHDNTTVGELAAPSGEG
jgi:hypothetical protein